MINKKILIASLLLVLLSLSTHYYGSIDIKDYSDPAKFFAGEYSADIRGSHSYLYGLIHAPFVWIFKSFFIFKITSLIFLFLIVYSVYIISRKDKKTLWLMLLSPVIWYMGPWINPIQLASFLFLWAWYFIEKYNKSNKLSNLLFSGIFVGLGWAFWDTILFLGIILFAVFFYNKKLSHSLYFIIFVIIGLSPRLLLDHFLFNFSFFTIFKSTLGSFANFSGGLYSSERATAYEPKTFSNLIPVILSIPIFFWSLYHPSKFKNRTKTMMFLSLVILIILYNPQVRYTLSILPIIILMVAKEINERKFRTQITISVIILLLFITPYLIQVKYSVDNKIQGVEFADFLDNFLGWSIKKEFPSKLIQQDLVSITREYPNQSFVVGNLPDDYQILAHLYWGKEIKEFVSIQDYNLAMKNETILFEKKFMPVPNIKERRQIWIVGGVSRNENDNTSYKSIKYGIGLYELINISNSTIINKYNILYLSKLP